MRLRKGDNSTDVALWQGFLNKQGFDYVKADTAFGPATEKATKGFQRICGITDDGIVGTNTIHQAKLRGFAGFGSAPTTAPAVNFTHSGPYKNNGPVRQYTDAEILARVESLDTFKGWQDGWYDIWVRSAADKYDEFDDVCFTYKVEKGVPIFKMKRIGTSHTGSFGLMNFRTYNSRGCAVLKADHMVYGYGQYGYHKQNPKNPCYRQVKSWPYYRDNNRNRKAEEIGQLFYDIIGANVHRVRGIAKWIRNWSVACLVTKSEAVFNTWLKMLVDDGKPPLNMVILKEFG